MITVARMVVVVVFAAAGALGAAQGARDSAVSTAGGVVTGRVLGSDPQRPLRRARVTISGPSLPSPRTIATDEAGRFEFRDLPPGRFTLVAEKTGYLRLSYEQRRPDAPGRPIELRTGETLSNLTLLLPRISAISGRITDDLGDPVDHAVVSAMRTRYTEQGVTYVAAGVGETDATGAYRVLGLPPGDYYIRATVHDTWPIAHGGVIETLAFAPTFFPGTLRSVDARSQRLRIGEELTGVDFALIPGKAVRITGRVLTAGGQPAGGTTVYLNDEILTSSNGVEGGSSRLIASAPVDRDGSFTLTNIPSGSYRLQVRATLPDGHVEVASESISPIDADIEGLLIAISAGARITGAVDADGAKLPPQVANVRVVGQQVTPQLVPLAPDRDSGRVAADASFAVTGLFGTCLIRVIGLPRGWALKAVYAGGREITDVPIDFVRTPVEPVRVVISNRFPTVHGAVVADDGSAALEYTVVWFSEDSAQWKPGSRFIRVARPDQHGAFDLQSLPPGRYFAAALADVESERWFDPAFLSDLRQSAQRVDLHEGDHQTVSLRLRP